MISNNQDMEFPIIKSHHLLKCPNVLIVLFNSHTHLRWIPASCDGRSGWKFAFSSLCCYWQPYPNHHLAEGWQCDSKNKLSGLFIQLGLLKQEYKFIFLWLSPPFPPNASAVSSVGTVSSSTLAKWPKRISFVHRPPLAPFIPLCECRGRIC